MIIDDDNGRTGREALSPIDNAEQTIVPAAFAEKLDESPVTIDFDHVARGSKLVHIQFRGQVYQLRSTKNGKLILNK